MCCSSYNVIVTWGRGDVIVRICDMGEGGIGCHCDVEKGDDYDATT